MKKITKGNDFTLRIAVMKMVEGERQPFPLPACTDVQVRVCNGYKRIDLAYEVDVESDNIIKARVEGDQIPLGNYAVEVKGKLFDNDWRSEEYPQFQIVARNADADTEFGETDEGDNSVEMDSALVILPPTVELTTLIEKAEQSYKEAKELNASLSDAEKLRVDAETLRSSNESERINAEKLRAEEETKRKEAESLRVESEDGRVSSESDRKSSEDERKKSEDARVQSETSRVSTEDKRVSAETERASAESLRSSSEDTRKESELARVDAENIRVDNENERIKNEQARVDAEGKRAQAESSRSLAETEREKAETKREDVKAQCVSATAAAKMAASDAQSIASEASKTVNAANETLISIVGDESKRIEAEQGRAQAEIERASNENARVSAENSRKSAETERATAEESRVSAENSRSDAETKRVKAEESREATMAKTKADCEEAAKKATDAASEATLAKTKAETAAEGAEKVNVELSGDSITVTDRNGDKSSIKVIAVVEKVTVTVTSQVDEIKTSGLKVNVFLNNGKTPQTYNTDAEGKCTFEVDKGSYYEVTVPEFANAQPLSPIGYTASIESREITLDYKPYDEETSEKVIVTVTKYVDKKDAVWQGKDVKVKYDGKTTTYTTDEKGQTIIYVPYKKEYTVTVDNEDGYMVYFGKNSRTYTARVSERRISVKMYQFKTGIFVMDSNADIYTIEEWQEAGKTSDEAVAIKVADYNLMANNGTFLIRTSDLQNMSKLTKLQWCTQNLQFNSIALNGNTSSDANYWNGEQSTFLVKQEAEERSLSVPAFDYAYNQTFEIGDNIGDTALHGFMMSVGQEYMHIANAGVIRDVLTALYGEDVGNAYYKFVSGNYRWTSTQYNATLAWYCSSQAGGYNKSNSNYVLPVFAC